MAERGGVAAADDARTACVHVQRFRPAAHRPRQTVGREVAGGVFLERLPVIDREHDAARRVLLAGALLAAGVANLDSPGAGEQRGGIRETIFELSHQLTHGIERICHERFLSTSAPALSGATARSA